ncbi:ribosome maturation factor RimM [Corynebacterium sp. 13CS0277]|uniref:ribosome maturation factor RimM n=1 Tax=Corynebacterium sp. 13CS0277 TaxID=2071994 RepID=UPI000D043895|nr:ribosome maturation factor RimM [Corynebacterium sp. 13CS0277]PRQ12549.1 ribosome maturation factor RimM [Corynebacterium sp. 13CS0277]
MTSDVELLIGRVIKAHGIRGEVAVEPTTDEPDIRFAVGQVLHGTQSGKEHTLTVAKSRPHQGRLLVTFEEIADRTAAESLRGTQFFAPPLDDDDDEEGFYDHELEGLRVIHDGEDIGAVDSVSHGPAGTLLSVALTRGGDALVPFVHAIVPEVDLESGTLTITPPEGLLDLDSI